MDIMTFIGRLHPLVVHLPIGFLLLALLVELFLKKEESKSQKKIILFILVLGGISSLLAATCGWFLALDGAYESNILNWHRWLGIATCSLAIVAICTKYFSQKKLYRTSLVAIGFLLMGTGHYGGSLTHGSDYLTQPLKGKGVNENPLSLQVQNPDSIIVYNSFIRPIFEQKCFACHNTEKDMGGLNLVSHAKLLEGGDQGKVVGSEPWSSELFLRVTLPHNNKKFMPPKGLPLDYSEINLLKWWIEQGADSLKSISEMEPDKTIIQILASNYHIDANKKPFIESVQIKPIEQAIIDTLIQKGWHIAKIVEKNGFLEVAPRDRSLLSNNAVVGLEKIKENITWLDLSDLNLTTKDIDRLSLFKNVTKLQLNNNTITDEGLGSLSKLIHLESLNLVNNPVVFEKLDWLKPMTSLKRIYLWKTGVKPESIELTKKKYPEIQLIQ